MGLNTLCILFIITFVDRSDGFKADGEASLYNCWKSLNTARRYAKTGNITVAIRFDILPRWTPTSEWDTKNVANNPLHKYVWSFKLARLTATSGRQVETNLDPSKMITRNSRKYNRFFSVSPYQLPPGDYKVSIKATPKNPKDVLKPFPKEYSTCYISIMGLLPEVIISGGTYRTVAVDEMITVNGEESYDRNFRKKSYKNLSFYWNCTQKIQSRSFCDQQPVSTESKFTIPSRYALEKERFTITLTASSNVGDKANFTQIIEVVYIRAKIQISCEKNCPPASLLSNYRRETYLTVRCISDCRGVKNEDYEWSVRQQDKKFNFDYKKNTQFGRVGTKFFIFKDVFRAQTYEIRVKLRKLQRQGEAVLTLNFIAPPNVARCSVTPTRGQTLITRFTLNCDQGSSTKNNFYELIAKDNSDPSNERIIVHGNFPQIFEYDFRLPPSSRYDFVVKVSIEGGPTKEIKVNPTVQESNVTVQTLIDIYNGPNNKDSIRNLFLSGNETLISKGIRNFQAVVDHLVQSKDIKADKFVNDLKYGVISDVLRVPLKTFNEIAQVAEAITNLMTYNEPSKADPLLAKFSTIACNKIVKKQIELLSSEEFPLNSGQEIDKASKIFQRCLETNTNPNEKAIAAIEYNITTEIAPTMDKAIEENYENYEDFNEQYYKNYDNLKQATYNILNATVINSKVVAMTRAAGEKFVELFGNKSATIIAKDRGEALFKAQIKSQGVTLFPSADFADDEHNYDILMSTWNKDILWWNRDKTEVATDIANIQFWHSTCKEKVTSFKEPATLKFIMKDAKDLRVSVYEDTIDVPRNYGDLSGEDLSRMIKVRRLLIPKRQTIRVHIMDLIDHDAINIVITKLKFPTAEDFSDCVLTERDANIFFSIMNDEEESIWYYIGILPNRTYIKRNSPQFLTYKLSTTIICCMQWSELHSHWRPYCSTKNVTEEDVIECECHEFSTVAGYLQSVESTLQEVLLPELELALHSTHVIFLTVAITFGIYCFTMIFLIFRKKDDVYFLGDNNREHRFAYLIEVKTGRRSGTTSNVSITLIGDRNSSEPHVLNYPDPKLNILQKFGDDRFILTTKHHLGKLLKIELWLDYIGSNPDWYDKYELFLPYTCTSRFCEAVIIFDMQKNTRWYFRVRKLLTVLNRNSHIEVFPTTPDLRSKINFCGHYHTWCLWCTDHYFGHVQRLTIILSTILTNYVVVLMFYGVPKFHLDDGVDVEYDVDSSVAYAAFLGSFPGFLVHFVMAWAFRFSEVGFLKPKLATSVWVMLIGLMSTNISILVVSGFWLPYNKSLMWLIASTSGILFCVIVYEPIFALFQNFFCHLETKLNFKIKSQNISRIIEVQRQILHQQFGKSLLRPYLQHLYKPLDLLKIKDKSLVTINRRHVISELEDLVMFFTYIIILYVVILANKDKLIAQGRLEMEDVVNGLYSRTDHFHNVTSIQDLYEYINTTLIASMQPSRWYGNYAIADPGMMIDATNKFIGIARLRQQRIKSNSCMVPELMRFLTKSCASEYSFVNADIRAFGYITEANHSYLKDYRLRDIWKYASSSKTGSLGVVGEFSTYSGGGYVASLGRTLHNSYANFRQIFEKTWVDLLTRSVFIEFLTYNVNYNVFNSVSLRFEQSATGYTYKTVEVSSARMLFVHSEVETSSFIFLVLFIVWVAMLFFKNSIGLLRHFRTFYKDPWLLTDFFIISMSVTCITLFLLRIGMIKIYLKQLERIRHNEFLQYFYLFYLEDLLTVFAGILVCVATIRLWKFLRFFVIFRALERTLSISALPLLTVTLSYSVIVFAVAIAFHLLYGDQFQNIDSVMRVVKLLLMMTLRAADLHLTNYTERKLALFFITLYSIFLKVVMIVFVTIILMSYSEAQMEFSVQTDKYNIKHYIHEKVAYLPRYIKYKYRRMKGGQETKNKVEPKDDKFLYLDSLSINKNRIRAMKYVTECVIRNIRRPKYLTEHDRYLILSLCRVYLLNAEDHEVDIFFKGRMKGKNIALVDERKILNIAKVVKVLLQEPRTDSLQEGQVGSAKDYERCSQYVKSNLNTLKECDLLLKLANSKLNTEVILSDIRKIQ